jgi:acetyl-CoA C-acetyltransferase
MLTDDPIVIVGAARTPMGSFLGIFKDTSAWELGAMAIKAALERTQLSSTAEQIEEVLMGCVLTAGQGQAPARQAAIAAGLPLSTGCTTINKMCGSGMKAVMLASSLLLTSDAKAIIAGGMESMSNAPYLLPKARSGYRIGHQQALDHMLLDGLEDAYQKGRLMGCFAEDCASHYALTREMQDAFAISSLKRAQQAVQAGIFADEITPVLIKTRQGEVWVEQDEAPMQLKVEKIPQLKPAFDPKGTVTAANSSSITDGAAALVLMRESEAIKQGLRPLAHILDSATHAQEPQWFTTAPVAAIRKLLHKLHWEPNTVDLYEINEAFAVVPMVAMQELQIAHEKINIHGGACALGHPIGASGARILVTLLYALQRHQLKRGIASLCIGGGEATAMAIERCL